MSMNPKHAAESLHFYRIILHQTQKLALPKRFVSIYGNELSDSAILRAPSGREWHVELTKCDGEIWLTNGWKDFVDYFCLKHGNLLIFRYQGHSKFYVFMIFDQTTFEIEYPIDISTRSKNGNHDDDDVEELKTPKVEEVDRDDSVEITMEKPPSPRFSPRKRTRRASSSVMQGTRDVKKPEFRMTRRYGSTCKVSPKEAGGGGGGTSAARGSSTTSSSRANCFVSENLSFVVHLRKSHLKGNYVHIPIAPVRNSWTRKEAKVVVLKDQDGETWPVHLVLDKRNYLAFGYGWMAFAIYNDLQVGDSCAFELLEGPEMSFRVTVSRNSEDSNDCHTSGRFGEATHNKIGAERVVERISSQGSARALERVSELRSDHPFFKAVITANFLKVGHPGIPDSFCDEHIERLPEDVTLKFKGKSWPLRMVPCSDRRGKFGGGWHAFACENKLKVGDVCVFEMIKKRNIVFKVSIFRDGLTLG